MLRSMVIQHGRGWGRQWTANLEGTILHSLRRLLRSILYPVWVIILISPLLSPPLPSLSLSLFFHSPSLYLYLLPSFLLSLWDSITLLVMVQPAILLDTRFIHYHYQESRSRGSLSQEPRSQESQKRRSRSQESHSWWGFPSRGSWYSSEWYSREPHSFTALHVTWLLAFKCLIVSFTPFCRNIVYSHNIIGFPGVSGYHPPVPPPPPVYPVGHLFHPRSQPVISAQPYQHMPPGFGKYYSIINYM